jgi:hypothetical protein
MSNQQKLVNDVIALVRARNPIILIVTVEEKRVERALVEPLMTLRNSQGRRQRLRHSQVGLR